MQIIKFSQERFLSFNKGMSRSDSREQLANVAVLDITDAAITTAEGMHTMHTLGPPVSQ